MRPIPLVFCALALASTTFSAQGLTTPADWKWRTDVPARLVEGQDVPAGAWRFVTMAPGWHLTTGPGAVAYHPAYRTSGNYAVEGEIFLFPGEGQGEYGVFVGGEFGDAPASPATYLAFVARRDGQGAVLRWQTSGVTPVLDWRANPAILPHPGKDTVKNVMRVEVGPTEMIFSANGTEFGRIPRGDHRTDGQFGFRVGKDVNLHVSRLDMTVKLAPQPRRAGGPRFPLTGPREQ